MSHTGQNTAKEEQVKEILAKEEPSDLVATVAERLAAFNGESTPKKDEEEVVEESSAEEPEEKPEPLTPKEDKADEPKKTDDEGLPDNFVRAAIHQGWKPEEIDEFYQSNPEKAKRTFGNIYNSTNELSKQFAEIGRAKKAVVETPKPVTETKFTGVSAEKIKQLRETYDNDPIVDLIEAQNKNTEMLYNELQGLKSQPKSTAQEPEQNDVAIKELNNFFGKTNMNLYGDFYGKADSAKKWEQTLTAGQMANRFAVISLADDILAGAAAQHKEMSIDKALELAHLSVSDPIKEKIIQNNIKSTVVKREKSLSLPPKSATKVEAAKPNNRTELIDATTERMKKVFG